MWPLCVYSDTKKKLVEILDVEEGPCEVVSHTYDIDPSCFSEETCGASEIADCSFDGRYLIENFDDFHRAWYVFDEIFDVIEHFGGGGNGVEQIEGVSAGSPIE